jgi:hypothetical protein
MTTPEDLLEDPVAMTPAFSNEHAIAAALEGWGVFLCAGSANGRWQIQRFDAPDEGEAELESDDAAWKLVREGSGAHHVAARAFIQAHCPTAYAALSAESSRATEAAPAPASVSQDASDMPTTGMSINQAARWADSKDCVYRVHRGEQDFMAAAVNTNTNKVLVMGWGDKAYDYKRANPDMPIRVYTMDEVLQGLSEEEGEASCVPGPRDADAPWY